MKLIKINVLLEYVVYLVIITLPLSMRANNYLLAISFLLFLLSIDKKAFYSFRKEYFKYSFIITGFFFLKLVGLIYSEHIAEGIKELETSLSFIILPLILLTNNFIFENRDNIYKSFIIGTTITLLFSWINIAVEMLNNDEPLFNLFTSKYLYINLISFIDGHPTYLSLVFIVSIGFIFNCIESKQINSLLGKCLLLFHLIFLIQLMSRSALFFLFIFLTLYFFIKKNVFTILLLFFSCVLILGIFVTDSKTNKRVKDAASFIYRADGTRNWRFERFKLMIEIYNDSPVVGYGTADIDSIRKKKYISNKHFFAANNNYNAHNQFLEYLTTFGIIGGLIYVLSYLFLFYYIIRLKSIFFSFILGAIFFVSITESIFQRYMGVELFSIIACLIISYYHNIKYKIDLDV